MRDTVVVRSPLTPAEAERALREAIAPPPPFRWGFLPRTETGKVLGTVGGGTVRLRCLPVMRNSFSPIFRGRLLPEGGGTRLEGRFGVRRSVILVSAMILLILIQFVVVGITLIVLGDAEPEGGTWKGVLVLGVALGFGLFGMGIRFIGRQCAADEERMLLRFLGDALQAEPVPSPAAPQRP